jgi:hypothetical protein|tara:strand:- start:379 stop:909 length:531 start_codon:yes stop_codon:yes gene_type:complete
MTSGITVKGKAPSFIKKEEMRAIVLGTITVMAYHGYYLKRPQEPVVVSISYSDRTLGPNRLTGGKNGGWAMRGVGYCVISGRVRNKPAFTTLLIHETIHLCASFAESDEFIVSTMTDRLKPSIIEVADALASNTYRRAAFMAHTKPGMAYHKEPGRDCYNDDQWRNKATTKGTKSK